MSRKMAIEYDGYVTMEGDFFSLPDRAVFAAKLRSIKLLTEDLFKFAGPGATITVKPGEVSIDIEGE